MSQIKFKVIHIVRQVSPTSMPWNDLYRKQLELCPEILLPPLVPKIQFKSNIKIEEKCINIRAPYIKTNIIGMMNLIIERKKMLKRGEGTIYHIHNPSLFWVGILVKIISSNLTVVSNLHNEYSKYSSLQRLYMSVLMSVSAKVICVSRAIYKNILFVKDRCDAGGKFTWIRNGIDSKYFCEVRSRYNGKRSRQNNVVVIGRLVEQKNPQQIMSIFAKLKYADKLIWYGIGGLKNELVEMSKKLNIEDRIIWKGIKSREEVFEDLFVSKVYISCSRWEGIGVANIEAAGMGVKIFLSNIDPHKEIAEELELQTYPLDNIESWVREIDNCLKSNLGNYNAKLIKRVEERFDLGKIIEKYNKIYNEALE